MTTQTIALFVDAYRELNAKRLFWIVLGISALIVGAFGMVGIDENGLKILWWDIQTPMFNTSILSQATFYKFLFVNFGVRLWLTWGAAILALVSTASIFPDFLAGGAIELTLSKPIGRLRLFFTKYLAGLMFVGLQVLVFSFGAFLIIGIRGASWEPRVFLAVPIVLAFFSYLFCVCTLLGVLTRSTIASLILTLILWFIFSMIGNTEGIFDLQRVMSARQVEMTQADIARREEAIAAVKAGESENGFAAALLDRMSLSGQESRLEQARERLESDKERLAGWERWHGYIWAARVLMPKTAETADLLNRGLISKDDLQRMADAMSDNDPRRHPHPEPPKELSEFDPNAEARSVTPDDPTVQEELADRQYEKSLWWILGTSFAFQGAVLALAAWLFCRRDF